MQLSLRIWIIVLLASIPSFGQSSDTRGNGVSELIIDYEDIRLSRVATAVRVEERITLDGHLAEPAWRQAVPATDFLQWQPRHGELSPERTEVRFLYDADNLYVGVIAYDSELSRAVVKELKEDFNFQESDNIGIIIDSLHDRRSAFTFGVNIAGAKRDQQVTNDSQFNQDWDGVWDAKVSRNAESWISEFVIPFKTLRFSNSPTQEWGINMNRRILRRNEESMWSLVPQRYRISRISQAGTLVGLENIRQGRNLKVTPYVTAGVTQVRDPISGALLTPKNLTRLFCTDTHKDCGYDGGIDAKYSITPSLTLDATYRTDFAQVEVDQQQVNLTRFNLFFPEKRDFFLENAGTFSFGAPQQNSGGGNNSANLVPFFSRRIGLSSSGTPIPIVGGARVSGRIQKYDVGFISMKTERLGTTPSNNYVVGRVKRNLLVNSWIGALTTQRDSTVDNDYNRVYGADAHFQFFQKLEFDSYLMTSRTPNRSGRDQARKFQAGWRDEELTLSAEYHSVQKNFNPEVGFIRRREITQYSGDFGWRPLMRNSDLIRNFTFATSLDYVEGSETGTIETRTQEATAGVQFQNNGNINFTLAQTFDRLAKPFAIRRNLDVAPGDYDYLSYTLSASSGQSRRISLNGNITGGEFWDGHRKGFGAGAGWNPNEHFGVDFTYNRNQVDLSNGSFTTDLIGTRFVYGFNPRAFLNAFIQYNADTHEVSSNIRFDFLHHPLSHLYLVYNDRRDSTTGVLLERALILKLTNLFTF